MSPELTAFGRRLAATREWLEEQERIFDSLHQRRLRVAIGAATALA